MMKHAPSTKQLLLSVPFVFAGLTLVPGAVPVLGSHAQEQKCCYDCQGVACTKVSIGYMSCETIVVGGEPIICEEGPYGCSQFSHPEGSCSGE
jgi:hypothetical protein